MPSLKDIRGRIGSVRNIAQITRAMEMVAASRMRRAQDSILAARPYADELEDALRRVAGAAGLSEDIDPLLAQPPGAAGGDHRDHHRPRPGGLPERERHAIGAALGDPAGVPQRTATVRWRSRRSPSAARAATPCDVPASRSPPTSPSSATGRRIADVTPIARLVTDDFLAEKYDEIDIAYSTFVSTLSQRPEVDTLLPVVQPEMEEEAERTNDEYLFEPSPEAVLAACCRATWRSASIGPCSRTTPPSSRRA